MISIDRVPERLAMAATHGRAETIDIRDGNVQERLLDVTDGRGPGR